MNGNCKDHTDESVEQQVGPRYCSNGCGFFANGGACLDMCSKCYRETISEQQRNMATEAAAAAAVARVTSPAPVEPQGVSDAPKAPAPATGASESPVPESAETPTATNITSGSLGNAGDDQPAQKNLNRCFACNKRVGLTGFKCRCGYVFCGSHRYAEAHSCKFDYKALGREHLAKSNPLVMADKINKF